VDPWKLNFLRALRLKLTLVEEFELFKPGLTSPDEVWEKGFVLNMKDKFLFPVLSGPDEFVVFPSELLLFKSIEKPLRLELVDSEGLFSFNWEKEFVLDAKENLLPKDWKEFESGLENKVLGCGEVFLSFERLEFANDGKVSPVLINEEAFVLELNKKPVLCLLDSKGTFVLGGIVESVVWFKVSSLGIETLIDWIKGFKDILIEIWIRFLFNFLLLAKFSNEFIKQNPNVSEENSKNNCVLVSFN